MLFARAMEMSVYRFPLEDDEVCPKCGREGCTCGPECDCGDIATEEAVADLTEQKRQRELIQDFE